MLTNKKTTNPLPIGITGLNFSKRITAKYAIFRKSGRMPDLIYLRLCGIRFTKRIKVIKKMRFTKKINIIILKSTYNLFRLFLNPYLKPLIPSLNLNKTGLLLQGAGQRSNLVLRLLYFLHNDRESVIMHTVPFDNIIVPPAVPDFIIKKGKAPYHINLPAKIFAFLRIPLGDMKFINNLNNIGHTFHYQCRITPCTQMDRLEIPQDQVQRHTPMVNPGEASLKLQTKGSRVISQISDRPFSASKSRQLPLDQQLPLDKPFSVDRQFQVNKPLPVDKPFPVEVISMGGLFPLSFFREKDLQDRPVNTQQTWQFSHLTSASLKYEPHNKMIFSTLLRSPDVSHNKMRSFTLPRSPGETIMRSSIFFRSPDVPHNKMRSFTLPRLPGERIMNLRVEMEENEHARSGSSGENAFSRMALVPLKVYNPALRSDSNIIPEAVHPGPDNNIYNNIQERGHVWQEMSLSGSKEPFSNITTITPTNLILRRVIREDIDILSRNKKGTETTTSTKTDHINNTLISLIHKKTGRQNTETALENRKILETEKTITAKIIDEDLSKYAVKESPIQGINMIADKVYKIIEKRIAIEKDRRGSF